MKKNQHKIKQQPKTKIQLKIKSKNVTNNFILTPRTPSLIDQKDTFHRLDKFTEEIKSQRQKRDEPIQQKGNKDGKRPEYRVVITDPKTSLRKKYQQDETGTHTPLLKRISFTSQIGNKKKSTHSLMNTERSKQKRKVNSKLSNSTSGEINKNTLHRLIGVIIKDYRDGRLKQTELQQTLVELYDRKQKKKSVGKNKKKKDLGFNTFSNQYIKSSQRIRSEALVSRRKKSDEIQESILQRKGFVNKIVIRGITTSLFLKQDSQLTNLKQNETKSKIKQSSYQINTSNSIKEIYEDMLMVKEQILFDESKVPLSIRDQMAIKIQRAWKRYKTRKILKDMSSRKQSSPFHIIDQFTDEQNDQAYNDSKFTRNIVRPNYKQPQSNQYSELVNLISNSLQQKNVTKQQCLKNILHFLKYPQQIIIPQHGVEGQKSQDEKEEQSVGSSVISQSPVSRVIIFNQKQVLDQRQQLSNELQSFTNKYSSKQNHEKHQQFMQQSQLDESLTFAHSQTSGNESFKMFNIQNIEEGLRSREESLKSKKQKQLQELTERFFVKKLTKQQYLRSKDRIEKWFKSKERQLKKIKNSLIKSCLQAKSILQNIDKVVPTQKSKKMMKCLSDKYIKNHDWLIKQESVERKFNKTTRKVQHLSCQHEDFNEQPQKIAQKITQSLDNHKKSQQLILCDNREMQLQQERSFEISPKLSRHISLEDSVYKYQEIEKIIEEDDSGLEEGLVHINKLESDKFISFVEKQDNDQQQISAEEISLINNFVNETNKKLKYLCTQDKQDIFEFLFLDLVLEMFTQLYPGQSKILKAAENYINRSKRLKKIPKGIKTNLVSCKQYLRHLQNYIQRKQGCLKGLSIPMGPSASEMLRYMRDEIVEADDEDESVSSSLVLPVDIFQKLGKTKELELKLERYYQDEQKQVARLSFLKTALHINNKALFDSLNQMLDHQRPYGVWGKPFPWKKTLSLDKKWTKVQQQKKLKISLDKTIECCSYLCGILVDKQESLFGSHRVSQQYIHQIRQDRLSKMLANDLIQNEERWIFYDDEQTQILMETSAFITKKLIKEMVLELMTIRMKI